MYTATEVLAARRGGDGALSRSIVGGPTQRIPAAGSAGGGSAPLRRRRPAPDHWLFASRPRLTVSGCWRWPASGSAPTQRSSSVPTAPISWPGLFHGESPRRSGASTRFAGPGRDLHPAPCCDARTPISASALRLDRAGGARIDHWLADRRRHLRSKSREIRRRARAAHAATFWRVIFGGDQLPRLAFGQGACAAPASRRPSRRFSVAPGDAVLAERSSRTRARSSSRPGPPLRRARRDLALAPVGDAGVVAEPKRSAVALRLVLPPPAPSIRWPALRDLEDSPLLCLRPAPLSMLRRPGAGNRQRSPPQRIDVLLQERRHAKADSHRPAPALCRHSGSAGDARRRQPGLPAARRTRIAVLLLLTA